ncbi:MAG: hypothetical protein ACOCVW_03165 [bacterium]
MTCRLNVAVIACGGKARGHVRDPLNRPATNRIVMVSDPALIETQRRTGGVLAVAFNGSLSPQVREAALVREYRRCFSLAFGADG